MSIKLVTHSYFRVFQMSTISRVWPTALKLGCITNLDMLFLVIEFISLIDEIQFMLISSRCICISSIGYPDLISEPG